jgi:UDP-N-acetyl-D-galactosamine dehydrogenase
LKIAVVGLGYVGLPVAIAFAEKYPDVVGFDLDVHRVKELSAGIDRTGEVDSKELKASGLKASADPADLAGSDVFIVCVPTPIHEDNRPDLGPLKSASTTVGGVLKKGGVVIYESTVYPGITEEFCAPILAKVSGLKHGPDFKVGYSPERINPGDKKHTFKSILKVVAGEDEETTALVTKLYSSVVTAGVHVAPNIKVAEMAKAIENTQRDLNVALMNELAIICDAIGIRTKDVLEAAGTKWNFLPFTPGLVGGHCIGVDPYYLTAKAQLVGYHPEVILAGRRINDSMGEKIARKVIRLLSDCPRPLRDARVGVLGLTFKENVPDIRNSHVFDIIEELKEFGINAIAHDPLAEPGHIEHEYGVSMDSLDSFKNLDALVFAVPHQTYLADPAKLYGMLVKDGAFVDVKSAMDMETVPAGIRYWSL